MPSLAGDVHVGGKVVQVAVGGQHTCVLLEGGTVRCWGDGLAGVLGYGNQDSIGENEKPSSVGDVDVGGKVTQIATGRHHTCVLLEGGTVRCWGEGFYGQLGYGNTNDIGDDEMPSSAGDVDVGGKVIQIAVGEYYTCALLEGGTIRCWGQGFYGQLGYGKKNNIGDNEKPSSVGDVDVGGKVIQIVAGVFHTCALLEGGAVRCWGLGEYGKLGYGSTNNIGDDETPAAGFDADVGGKIVQIATGQYHTCALLEGGAVRCWGGGFYGQLGYGNEIWIGDNEKPSSVGDVDVGGKVTQIATGQYHTCALLEGGTVRCWGLGEDGRLGYGNTNDIGDDEKPSATGDISL